MCRFLSECSADKAEAHPKCIFCRSEDEDTRNGASHRQGSIAQEKRSDGVRDMKSSMYAVVAFPSIKIGSAIIAL